MTSIKLTAWCSQARIQTSRHADRQKDREMDRQTDGYTDRQTGRNTDRKIEGLAACPGICKEPLGNYVPFGNKYMVIINLDHSTSFFNQKHVHFQ